MSIPLTVALLTYNRSHYLRESLEAILGQTYKDFEILVMDNGSTDDTPEVILRFKDDRIRYVRNAPGDTAFFNAVSAKWIARGDRILITHDDDIMEPTMLERQMAMFEAMPELRAVWTNQSIIDADGNLLQATLSPPGEDRIFGRGEFIAKTAEEQLWHPPSSLLFNHRELTLPFLDRLYRGIGNSARAVEGGNDIILPAMMNLKGPVAFLNAPLLRYRQHAGQETHRVHLARAALSSFRGLRRLVRKTSYREEYEPIFSAQLARYQAQDLVLSHPGATFKARAVKRLESLLVRGGNAVAVSPRSAYPLLPLIVLLMQIGAREAALEVLRDVQVPNPNNPRSVCLLYRWAERRRAGGNIFAGIPSGANVVILGTVLVSALLVNEVRDAGANVVCCLDSSGTRQGLSWLGVPVVHPSWLASRDTPIDLIVLSSERDHEVELEEFLRRHDASTPIVSWKLLVESPNFPPLVAGDNGSKDGAVT